MPADIGQQRGLTVLAATGDREAIVEWDRAQLPGAPVPKASTTSRAVLASPSIESEDVPVQRAVVMVTGMSGSGKSTVLAELAHRGHRVVDTDEAGWIIEVDTADGLEPLWDLDRVRAHITGHRTGWLFVSGCVANQGALYEHFDAVVLLSAPLGVILARVEDRANTFGSTPQDRAKIHADLAAYEPLLRAGADHEVKTTVAVAEVATALERIAGAAWPSG